MSAGLHILIADDHSLFRQGLRFALEDGFDGARVSETGTLEQALSLLGDHTDIGLASFDLRMPGMGGGEGLRQVRRLHPTLPIAVLSGSEDRRTILAALEQGASGFIPKSLPAEAIVAAMREIIAGRVFVPTSITVIDQPAEHSGHDTMPAAAVSGRTFDPTLLTPRQREVLDLLLTGLTTKEIGRELEIAEGTVKIYVAAIFRALDVRNRVQAIARATALGFSPKRPG